METYQVAIVFGDRSSEIVVPEFARDPAHHLKSVHGGSARRSRNSGYE